MRTAVRDGAALAGAVLMVLLVPARAGACSVCGCGDPLLGVSDSAGLAGSLRLGLEGEVLSVTSGSESMPGANDRLDQQIVRAQAVYSPTSSLNLSLELPVTHKRMVMEGAGSTMLESDLTGLGDVELAARLFVLNDVSIAARRRHSIAVSAGTSLPTGPSGATAGGVRIDEHGQLGTGGFGPFAGVLYSFQQDPWAVFASVSGRYRTESSHGYRYGPALLWTLEGQVQPLEWLGLGVGLDGRSAATDVSSGATVENTGGTVLAVSPGLHVRLAGTLWLSARAQLPIVTVLEGRQTVGPTYLVGLQVQAL